MQRHWAQAGEMEIFVSDEDGILLDDSLASVSSALTRSERLLAFELAGPRRSIFFDPAIQGDLWHSLIEATGQSPKFF
jgi:hypothetical protein